MAEVVRIGNCSGFYGDRFAAWREMLDGGPLDVLTGDYLAELTMLILGKDTVKDPGLGYARTFVKQAEDAPQRVTGPALDFCLLVTQRAHRADLALTAEGPDADRWLDIAQAFAGPPGDGRTPKGDTAR